MDDRELEARLSQRLHDRFDVAPVPVGLAATVRQGMEPTTSTKVRFAFRPRALQIGWATLAVVVAVGALLAVRNGFGPASPRSTPTAPAATVTPPTERRFVLLPRWDRARFSKDEATVATDVLTARLRALGYENFSSFGGFGIRFEVPVDGPSDESTQRVLTATGDVQFVPLPPADYPEAPSVGKPLPKDEPALFGWDGIESVSLGTNQQSMTTLDFELKPAARRAFGEYTAAHVNETIAIVIDGLVAAAPNINEPIPGGSVQVVGGGATGSAESLQFAEISAILVGGILPESWRDGTSPTLLTEPQAVDIALRQYPGATVGSTTMYFTMHGTDVEPVWSVTLSGSFPVTCGDPQPTDCSPWSFAQVLMDAVTGEVIMP
ncbi:MAG TPA: hypothetical protein VJ850_02895 [Candidatus Limnocylindrales bacterium]|nr:hypothetical protein [Candidatus Limnocylindrales bacterium]